VLKLKNEDGSFNGLREYKEPFLDYGNAVINDSLFTQYLRKHGVAVNKSNRSLDLLMMKFDWGVEEDDSGKEEPKPAMSVQQLRDYYYEKGAAVTWNTYDSKTGKVIEGKERTITYKMLFRNQGKAKEGQCLFIRKDLHEKVLDYLTMGLWKKIPNVKGAKIVEMSA